MQCLYCILYCCIPLSTNCCTQVLPDNFVQNTSITYILYFITIILVRDPACLDNFLLTMNQPIYPPSPPLPCQSGISHHIIGSFLQRFPKFGKLFIINSSMHNIGYSIINLKLKTFLELFLKVKLFIFMNKI